MKRIGIILAILTAGLLFTADLSAQIAATATWPLTNPSAGGTGQGVTIAGQIVGYDQLFKNMEVNGYTGTNSSQRARMAGTGNTWPANQTTQIDTVYMQFRVSPKPSFVTTIDSVVLRIGAGSLNNMKANIYYSKDSTFASKTQVNFGTSSTSSPAGTYLSSSALDVVAVAPNLPLNQKESFYIRIYPWVDNQAATASGKYVCVQNVIVYATARALPVPASVTWTLAGDENATIAGLLVAGREKLSDSLELYGFTNVGSVQCGWMVTKSHVWTAQTAIDPQRYVQYSVAPQTGGTFYIDSIGMSLGAAYTNNLHAGVFYSHDSAFATSNALFADTSLMASALVPYSVKIKDTVRTGQKFYLRIYPFNRAAEGWAKLMYVSNVAIGGVTSGVAISAPTITTLSASSISTTFATSGGNVTADGGGPVTARGVCWNTAGSPTVAGSHTSDDSGTGSFTSSVTGLVPGTTYRLRAYATNVSGTSYGSEIAFTTLQSIVVPAVTTSSVTSILVKTAVGGGNVTDWGGATVTVKGICWDTLATPTTSKNKTLDGAGIGSFTSGLTGLRSNTTYYVRAYATNSAGTGYGAEQSFKTQEAQSDTTVVVAKDGTGNYTTVQAAFRAVPPNYTGKWRIFVKKGRYQEKDTLAAAQVNVVLVGEDRDSTVIWNDDYADKYGSGNPGTSGTFTMSIDADDFVAKNITIQNTYAPQTGVSGSQAVALSANGDRQEYYNVALRGFQDTYYTRGSRATGRTYHKNCYVEGTVDFIFGRNIAVFDSCTIRELRNGGTLTAASTDATSQYGYVFRNCTIVADSIGYDRAAITGFYLGRPWQASPRTVFLNCSEPANLNPAGWLAWNVVPALYSEFKCTGPGAATANRASWSSQLSATAAASYTLTNMFARNAATSSLILCDWKPTGVTAADEMPLVTSVETGANEELPSGFSLAQNYPNPFNPVTHFEFRISDFGFVSLKVFDVLGREVATVVNEVLQPGTYKVRWDGSAFPSGMYLYSLKSGDFSSTRKMLLIK